MKLYTYCDLSELPYLESFEFLILHALIFIHHQSISTTLSVLIIQLKQHKYSYTNKFNLSWQIKVIGFMTFQKKTSK